jgi:uncharacterized membrane protein YagU involved in acid resistance
MKLNVGRAILGGFIGTVMLTLMMYYVAPMMMGQKMDIAEKLGSMMGGSWMMGMIVHFINGTVIFALIYAYILFRFLPGPPWLKGLLWGAILWLLLEIVMMPMMGSGVFSSHMGGIKAVMAALIGHLVYGTVLGATAGAPAQK